MQARGLFIAIEGIEGSGKTTQVALLADYCEQKGIPYLRTREPGGSRLSQRIRGIVLDPETKISDRAEVLLYLADRAEHVAEVLEPALLQGRVVLCDRYEASSFAYQCGGRGIDKDALTFINQFSRGTVTPDFTFWLDLDPYVGLARARVRGNGLDRIEREEMAFHYRVRQGFADYFTEIGEKCLQIDALRDSKIIHAEIVHEFQKLLDRATRKIVQ